MEKDKIPNSCDQKQVKPDLNRSNVKALTTSGTGQWRRFRENYSKVLGKLLFLSIKSHFQSLKLTFDAKKKKLSFNVAIIFPETGATVPSPLW